MRQQANEKDRISLCIARVRIKLHVRFSYIKDRALIRDFSLHASPGQRIAIVGPTGCGKTTLINLLMRFYDVQCGEICVDGHETRALTRHSLRSAFGMDVGGGTTDLSVWLGGATRAAQEASLLLGCRQILFDSLADHRRERFEADFANAEDSLRALVRDLARAFARGESSLRVRQKNVFLLDAFFAGHSAAVADAMAQARAQGSVTLLECLLLLNFGYLFRLCGEMLNQCDLRDDTRALLHPRMEICVAGNGGQFLKMLDDDARDKLFRLALSGLNDRHPVRELLLVQSRHPKQEVAIGLLTDDSRLRSTVQGSPAPAEAAAPDERRRRLLGDYIRDFYAAFPQAGELLMGNAFVHDFQQRQPALAGGYLLLRYYPAARERARL